MRPPLKVRFPRNAGSWYAGTATSLKKQIEEECFLHILGPRILPKLNPQPLGRVRGLLCPHAGYMYSGPVASHSYKALAEDGKPETLVIIGPNHTGMGSGVSLMAEGIWKTPIGEVSINSDVAKAIQRSSTYIDRDDEAHIYEHSIELQLPFLQYVLGSEFTIVPICMLMQDPDVAKDVGEAIAAGVKNVHGVIIASSDLTHYEAQGSAERKDRAVIEAMKKLDEVELYKTVRTLDISMCGVGPVAATIIASKIQDARKGTLLKYATSGDVTGDRSAVVGYCSMVFSKS